MGQSTKELYDSLSQPDVGDVVIIKMLKWLEPKQCVVIKIRPCKTKIEYLVCVVGSEKPFWCNDTHFSCEPTYTKCIETIKKITGYSSMVIYFHENGRLGMSVKVLETYYHSSEDGNIVEVSRGILQKVMDKRGL
jgi:hypothetical protein